MHSFGHPVFWLATDPTNANRLYASVIRSTNGSTVGGVYVCNNIQSGAQAAWTELTAPPRTQGHPACITVLNDGSVLATYSGRIASGAFTASSGLFVYNPSTQKWTDVSDPGMHYWTKDVVVDPADSKQNTWYVCVFSGWGGPPNGLGGLYQTTNRGATWTRINALDRVTSITFNPLNANEAFLTTETNGLWRTENIHTPSPVFNLVSTYPFRQPERVFFNPYNPGQMWVSSFGNCLETAPVGFPADFSLKVAPAPSGFNLLFGPILSGVTYIPEYSSSISPENWLPIPSSTQIDNNGIRTVTDLSVQGSAQRFYHVRTTAP